MSKRQENSVLVEERYEKQFCTVQSDPVAAASCQPPILPLYPVYPGRGEEVLVIGTVT